MSLTNISDILVKQLAIDRNSNRLHEFQGNGWASLSTEQINSGLHHFRHILQSLQLQKGDLIIIIPDGATFGCFFLDMAIQSLAMVSVLVHKTTKQQQWDQILDETKAQHVFIASSVQKDAFITSHSSVTFHELAYAADPLHSTKKDVLIPVEDVDTDTLSTIIYTSGTTGRPKGVMLSHGNILANVAAMCPLLPLDHTSRVLSLLPYSHAFERTLILSYLAAGTQIYFLTDRNYFSSALEDIHPHAFAAVPRIIEKMYQRAEQELSTRSTLQQRVWKWAIAQGEKYRPRSKYNPLLWGKLFLIRHIIFRRFRKRLGDSLQVIIVGAAHLNPALGRLFSAAGVHIREGYGLTEASPVVTVNRMSPGLNRFGTVGIPLAGVKIKLVNEDEFGAGEIYVKGPNVMLGYYNQAEETAKVITSDGWFKTGDVGKLINNRFLQITDRKKDLFKTSSGKYIAPSLLSSVFMESRFIDQIMIVGFQRSYLVALIYLSFDNLKAWANRENIHWTDDKYMILNIKIKTLLSEEIKIINDKLAAHECVRNFYLIPEEPSVENGLLSATLKPIRQAWLTRYAKEIEELYVES